MPLCRSWILHAPPRGCMDQFVHALAVKVFRPAQFYVAEILTRALQQFVGVGQRCPLKKTKRDVVLANHEIKKWALQLESRQPPRIGSLLHARYVFFTL